MDKELIISCVLCAILSHVSYAQDLIPTTVKHSPGQVFKVIETPDGGFEKVVIGHTSEQKLMLLEIQLERGVGPISQILDKLEPEDVSSLIADELTQAQETDLGNLLSEYRNLKAELDPDDNKLVAIRVEYGKKLSELLIPEQINGTRLSGYIFHELCDEGRLKKYLELSAKQQSDIESECGKLNSEINDLVHEFESKVKKLKERATKTLNENLTVEQQKKLERIAKRPLKDYFENDNLKSLIIHTELHPDSGPRY